MSFLMEVLFEVIAQLVFELLGEAAEHSFGRRRPTNKWVAYVRCIFLGSFVGLLATAVIPEPLLGRRITGISVLLAPLITASVMYLLGLWLQRRAAKPGTLTSFSGAWVFATAFSACRLWLLTRP